MAAKGKVTGNIATTTKSEAGSTGGGSKSAVGISGSAGVNLLFDNADAYVRDTGAFDVTGGGLSINATNGTTTVNLAGSVAYAGSGSGGSSSATAIGGAAAINILSGQTDAFIDGAASLALGSLSIDAKLTGWTVSIAAGFSGASGKDGVAVAGSAGVNVITYTTEATLENISGATNIGGAATLDADDESNLVSIGGSGGFGGKAGVGIAVGFTYENNTTQAEVSDVAHLTAGSLDVDATDGGLVIAATGSVGVATGSGGGKGYAGAGTVTINALLNTVNAEIAGSTVTTTSSGHVKLLATDSTSLYAVAGAVAAGQTAGLGGAVDVNVVLDTATALVTSSTINAAGSFTNEADRTGTVVSVAAAGAGSKKTALAAGIGVNYLSNTVEAEVTGASNVTASGAVAVNASDTETDIAVMGGVAISTGQAGIGAAVGVNLSYNTVKAFVDNASLTSTGSTVKVDATASEILLNVALGAAGGDKFALGGSVAVNETTNIVEAYITNGNSTVNAHGDITISAGDSTTMIVVSGGFAGSSKVAVGAAVSVTNVADTIEAYIDGATVTSSAGKVNVNAGFAPPTTAADLSKISTGASGITLPTTNGSQIVNVTVAGSGAGKFAAGAAISLNWLDNTVLAYIKDNAHVTGNGNVTVSATDSAQLDTGTLGAAGAGTAAVGAALAYDYIGGDPVDPVLNVPENPLGSSQAQVSAYIDGSTVESTHGNVYVTAISNPSLVDVTVGGAGAGKVAIGGSLAINFIRSVVDASIIDNAHVTADAGDVVVTATTAPTATVAAGAASGAGNVAVGIAASTTDFASSVTAIIDHSTVTAHDVYLTAANDSTIYNLTVGGSGAGTVAAGIALAVNTIDNTVQAEILDNANVNTTSGALSGAGVVSLSATDASTIDALAFGGAGSGNVAGGGAIAANIITNTIGTEISGSTVNAGSTVTLDANAEARIRALAIGVSGAGSVAISLSALGNYVGDTITSLITNGSTVTAEGNISVSAEDEAPSFLSWSLSTSQQNQCNSALNSAVSVNPGDTVDVVQGFTGQGSIGSRYQFLGSAAANVDLLTANFNDTTTWKDLGSSASLGGSATDTTNSGEITLSGNILAVMVSVAGSGSVAVSAALSGNIVHNVVDADIVDSRVWAGVDSWNGNVKDSSATVGLSATSSAGIMAITVGVGGSGSVAIQATGFGNVITDDTEAEISGGATVNSEGAMTIGAEDESHIMSFALSVAASGSAAISAIIGANVVTNNVDAIISASTVWSGSTLDIGAESQSTIYGFVGGVAASGGAAVQVMLAANVVANTTEARIEDATGAYSVHSGGAMAVTAGDSSEIDALGLGVSASGGGAVGINVAANVIANTIEAEIDNSSVDTGSTFTLGALSSEIIRGITIGVSGSGGFAVQVTAMGNAIANHVLTQVTNSTVTAQGNVAISAQDIAPSLIPGLSAGVQASINSATSGSPIPLSGNILAVMVSVAGTGGVAVNAALSGNLITNTIRADIIDSTVKAGYNTSGTLVNSGAGLSMTALSQDAIMALTVGVAGSGAVAVNATGFGDVITDTVASTISGGSTVKSGGSTSLSAQDKSNITSLGISVAGTGAVAVGALIAANVITNTVESEISGSTVTTGSSLSLDAESKATIIGLTTGVAGSGAVAAVISLSANVIDGTTEAAILNNGATASNVNAGGDITLTAKDTSEIDALAIGVSGTGAVAVGLAIAVNAIGLPGAANTVETAITGSTVNTSGALTMSAQSSEIIRGIAIGVSGSGGIAVQVTAMGNAIVNSTLAEVTGSTVTAANSVTISAQDIAPSVIPGLPASVQSSVNSATSGSPIPLSGNILALMVSVAGTGGVAVNGVLSGNLISNTIRADVIGSTVLAGYDTSGTLVNSTAGVTMTALSQDAIMALTVGVAGSGAVAVNATGFGDVITDTVAATISGSSIVKSGGSTSLSAQDQSHITSLGISVAGTGGVAVGALIGANVITNTIEAEVSGSAVTTGSTLSLDAESQATIIGMTAGVAFGSGAGLLALSANVITDTTAALIINNGGTGSNVTAGGAVSLTAEDTSEIDALAFCLTAGGGAIGASMAANVIANTIEANIQGSTLQTGSTLSQTAKSSAIIRTLSLGASGSAGLSVGVTVVGNIVTNTVEALITGSTVTAAGAIALSATDIAPSTIPSWIVPTSDQSDYNSATSGSPVSLSTANILSLVINIGGSGGVAATVTVQGNKIANTVESGISSSTVSAGVSPLTGSADISLTALTDNSIIAASAGFAAAGVGAISANLMGDQIANTVTATVTDSTVRAGGQLELSATDTSAITAIGLGFALSGLISGNVVVADNDIGNTIEAEIVGSDVETGSNVSATALSSATVLSFVGGIAVSGGVSGNLSYTINHVHNTVIASIEKETGTVSSVNAGGLSGSASAAVTVSAADASTIDSIAIGLSASAFGAIGAATAYNHINNTVDATVAQSTVASGGATDVTAASSEVIRSLAAGLSGAGGVAGQASVTSNNIGSTTEASVGNSVVTAGGEVLVKASDTAPATLPSYLSAAVPASVVTSLTGNLGSNSNASYATTANIVSFAGSIAGAGLAAGSAAVSTNTITNTISATVTDSTVTSTGSDVSVEAVSGEQIVSLAAGVGVAIGAAVNASATTNTITNNISAYINGTSTIKAGASSPVNVTAADTGSISSLALSLSGALGYALGGAVVTNNINDNTLAYVSGTSHTSRTGIDRAGLVTIGATSSETEGGMALGASLGMVAGGASVVTSNIGGSTEAYLGNYADVGKAAGMTVGGLTIEAASTATVTSKVWGLSGGIGAATYNTAASTVTPVVEAFTGTDTGVRLTGDMTVSAAATPQVESDAHGIAVGALAAGASVATATASPTATAYVEGTIRAANLTVEATDSEPSGQYAAEANATGSVGGLVAANATESTATNSGTVTGYLADNTTLIIGSTINVTATNNTDQLATANSNTIGLIAVGGNVADAESNVQTSAYMGTDVNIEAGTLVGGLTDGNLYYVVPEYVAAGFDSATDISGNEIYLGTNTGLETGDRVIYQTGVHQTGTDGNGFPIYTAYTAVGGLTNGAVYTITFDPASPGYVTLKDSTGTLVGSLDSSTATGSGQSFRTLTPTRVKLATSFDNATANTPTTIALSEPTIPGSDHTLTPRTVGTAAIAFDPSADLDTADGSIYVGPNSGLYIGEAVTYAKPIGPSLTVTASGDDVNLARSTAGSGGLVAGAGASATVSDTSTTNAYIKDYSSGYANTLYLTALTVSASHTAQFDSQANSIEASLAGASGASGTNNIDTTVEATIGASTRITTKSLDVTATSTTLKNMLPSGSWDVQAGSGGVLAGSAAESVTNITNNTSAVIGDNVSISVFGSISNPGDFVVSAYNDVEAYDSVELDAGGAIVGAGVVSHILANTNNATASLGNSDIITTVGDLDLEAYTRGILDVEPKAHTYGLASAASIDAEASMHENDAVDVGTDTAVTAFGNLNLLAGKNHVGTKNYFSVTSHGDELNASVIPISDLQSHGEVVQNNTVWVGAGSDLKSAKDANLAAETLGTDMVLGYGTGKNWMTALAGAINSALGGTPIPDTMQGGTQTITTTGTVTVDGTVEVCYQDQQSLTISMDTDGNLVTQSTGGITFTTSVESEANDLMMEFNYWSALAQVYAGTTAGGAYQAQANMVGQEMQQLGLTTGDSTNGYTYLTSYAVPYVTVNDIYAQAGTISVNGSDLVVGRTGTLNASGSVAVTIDNKSPDYLRIEGITIPDNAGGQVLFNYVAITSLIGTPGVSGTGTLSVAGSGGSEPTITIKSEFDAADHVSDRYSSCQTPGIDLAGNISNLLGTVTVNGKGSVTSDANLDAKTVNITAGGSYVQNYSNALSNAGGDPAAQSGWQAVLNQAMYDSLWYGYGDSFSSATDTQTAFQNDIAAALAAPPTSSIVSGANVFIAAEYLNIDGIVQSGEPNRQVTIGSNAAAQIANANTVYAYEQAGSTWYANYLKNSFGLQTSDGKNFKLTTDGSQDNISAIYDAQTQQIQLGSVDVQGGYMQLYGDIVSTGGGELKVLDGYGTVNITNNTSYGLVTNNINTGHGVAGQLLITDTAYTNGQGAPLTTSYTRSNGQVSVESYYVDATHPVNPATDPNYQVVANADPLTRSAVYTPASGQRYYWTEGEQTMTTTTDTYSASSWLGITAFYTPSNVTSSNTVVTSSLQIEPGAYIANSSDTSAYNYSSQSFVTSQNTQYSPVNESSTWYGKKTYSSTTTTETGNEYVYTSSIRADRQVNIDFIGSDSGGITVTSQGSVIVEGAIQDAAGTTAITSSGGQIEQGSATASVGGNNITLSASSGIGAGNALNVKPTNPNDMALGVLSATSAAGDIALIDTSGGMNIGQITTSQSDGDITITAAQSIYASTTSSLVRGGAITLTATGGNIGSFGTNGTYDNPAGDALPIRLDTGSDTTHDTFTATAAGNVYVKELTGDLRVNDITTPADVRVEAPNGNLTNANTNVVTDSRTWNQLLNMYTQMEATGTAANDSINATVLAYEAGQTQDYQTYWNYRNQESNDYVGGLTQGQTYYVELNGGTISLSLTPGGTPVNITASLHPGDGGADDAQQRLYNGSSYVTFDSSSSTIDNTAGTINTTGISGGSLTNGEQVVFERYVPYDPGYHVTLSANQQTAYTDYYTRQGQAQGLSGSALTTYVTNAITTLEGQRTQEYHTLNEAWGRVGNIDSGGAHYDPGICDPGFSYSASDPKLHETFGASAVSGSTIDLGVNAFTTGEAVVFEGGGATGAANGNLVNGNTYYVIKGSNPNDVSLAASASDADLGIAITLGTIGGSGNYLSDGDVLKQRASWSQSQLQNSFNASILAPKSTGSTQFGTATDITGRNVYLSASNSIGVSNGTVNVNLPLSDSLDTATKVALAAAEPEDITFYTGSNATGSVIDLNSGGNLSSAHSLQLNEIKSVDVLATGTLIFSAGTNVNVGSSGGMNLKSVNAGGEARIQAQQSLTDARSDSNAVITAGGNAILEGGSGGIGTSSKPFLIALSTGSLTARASGDIYLTETSYDMRLADLYSGGNIYLITPGSILDAYPDGDPLANGWKIGAQSAFLQAGDSIGTSTNYVETNLAGKITANAAQGIFLHEVTGASDTLGTMDVSLVQSAHGDVGLWAAGNLLDAASGSPTEQVAPVALGKNITLRSDNASINVAPGGLAVGFAIQSSGTLTSSSYSNTYVTETTGDLSLDTVQTTAGTAFISAPVGQILNGTGGTNITSGKTYLFADGDIGKQVDPIKAATPSGASVAIVQGLSTRGSIWLDNTGALDVSDVSGGSGPGMVAGGSVQIGTQSPLTVTTDIEAASITLTSGTPGEADSDMIVGSGVTIESTSGYVSLTAGEDLIITGAIIKSDTSSVTLTAANNFSSDAATVISGHTTVTIHGDAYHSGASDSIQVDGTITGSSLTILGGADNDTISLTNVHANTPTTIDAGAGNDTINIGSHATTTNTGGVLGTIAASLAIDGQGGTDTLNTDDTGDATATTDALTATTLTGLGMAGSITYTGIQTLNISLGSGADAFTIDSTHANTTNLWTNAGANTVYAREIDGATNIYDGSTADTINVYDTSNTTTHINALLTITGDNGADILNVTDTGDTTGRTGDLTATTLTGLGMAGSITYTGIQTLNISLGSGADAFTIDSTHANTTNLWTNAGANTVYAREIDGATNIYDGSTADTINVYDTSNTTTHINALLTITGDAGADILNVTDSGDTTGRVGDLTATTLTGLGMAGSITYTGIATLNMRLTLGGRTTSPSPIRTRRSRTFTAATPATLS